MPTSDNHKKGEIFEKYIISLYEALNFHVTPNANIRGQQVDVVAEKIIPGIGKTQTLVECKFLSSGSIANQVIYDWAAFINTIPKTNNNIYGVIVSNQGFSKEARLAAESVNITLMTETQLESEIYQLKEAYVKMVMDYEGSAIYEAYLPLDGRYMNGNSFRSIDNIGETIINMDYDNWGGTKFLAVLADFGSGKTTLMQRLNYQYAKRYLEGSPLKPIYFELKYFMQYQDLNLFMVNTYRKLFQKDIPIELFWKGVANGEFLLLLDGFDEMSPQVDRQIRVQNLQLLSKLLLSKSNSIISCRSSYFITDDELLHSIEQLNEFYQPTAIFPLKQRDDEILAKQKKVNQLYKILVDNYAEDNQLKTQSEKVNARAVIMEISELKKDQIDSYLKKFDGLFRSRCNATWKEVRDFCYKIYDIKDLLKKPILISMVKDTILHMGSDFRDENKVYDPSSLYEMYTGANLQRDFTKGASRQFLTQGQRQEFAEVIAFLMFTNNTVEITLTELYSLINEHSIILHKANIADERELEHVASDIVLCTFIKKTESSGFKFIHKSFMEFFVARRLKGQILKNDLSVLRRQFISQEILYFFGCYATTEKKVKDLLIKESTIVGNPKKKEILKRNLTTALLLSTNENSAVEIRDVILNETKFAGQAYKECGFTNVRLSNVKLSDIAFKDGKKSSILLINSSIENLEFINCPVHLTANEVTAIKLSFDGCEDLLISGDNFQVKEFKLDNSKLHGAGSINIENADFYNSILKFEDSGYQVLQKPSFDKVEYLVTGGISTTLRDAKITNSLLTIDALGVNINGGSLTNVDMILSKKVDVSESEWKSCSCRLSGSVSLTANTFESVTFDNHLTDTVCYFGGNEFNECTFFGIAVVAGNLKEFLKNTFYECHGVIFINSLKNQIPGKQFNNLGIMTIGELTLVDLSKASKLLIDEFRNNIRSFTVGKSINRDYITKWDHQ
ncbi:NACHT domain-containing protein [Mucilaginibacter sp. HC2]|uniref:restriction endonuclease n=1 Tax=Mucilaginibacter inviolabilis TaxID=2714892 RepID=UPI00140A239C|nr:restriction endonuclease [Mucilaginibacter inviolabilis]NHA03298.1 NACHT domain-containing protein [Mucilaginibacter inviolabilis]